MKIRLAQSLQSDSIVDGDGIRTVIWTQGCSHNCKGCHNPQTHSFTEGFLVDVEDIKKEISNLKLQDGITFSGGDPMFQVDACLEIAKFCQSNGLNVWMYTGFTFEQLIASNKQNINELLKYVDVLIDGRFILEQKSLNLMFRGSKNQRIINVKKSLKQKKVITIKEYNNVKYFKKEEFIYV
ncbi:MAG: anaerobic ribonucleoside-triphosphate reductase activating protein [Bacilli bacterium]|nr:anaerobic ribonucleoside-triphosphate reductase activating protein [Bacilli bacterium]MDD4733631.1 anaerobic ribonucleoside-triphosphate reductase activating protein [Bacilli bacterium]